MEIFLFEYVTSGGAVPEEIVVEGLGMFKSLLSNFKKVEGVRINSFVKSDFENLFPHFKCADENNIEQTVEEFAEESDYFLLIAPEDENTLLNLTKIAEERSENLGSKSKAIEIASDKWKTYKLLKGKVNVPETSKKPLDPPFVWKPRISCGGEGIKLVEHKRKLENGYIAQEFIAGKNLSVSLMVGEDINLLSVNGQLIDDFRYKGAEVPARIKNVDAVFEEAAEAVGCIKGLHGYVGVDVVLASEPFIIEINARPTTPSILFDRVYDLNLAALILKNHLGTRVDWRGIFERVRERVRAGRPLILKKIRGRKRLLKSAMIAEYKDWVLYAES